MKKTLILASALGLVLSSQAFAQTSETDADNISGLLGLDTNQASTGGVAMDDNNNVATGGSTLDLSSPTEAAVANGELSGTVAGGAVITGLLGLSTASNTIESGAMNGVSGITSVAQQSGANGLAQQNVVVQSNVAF